MFTRKTKTVSFRILEDEYENLKNLCQLQGARSVSEVARDALRRHCKEAALNGGEPETFQSRLEELDNRVRLLDREMGRLLEMVEK